MAASIYDWSGTAASNSNADSDIAWPEGQAPSTVNNSARAMMQRVQELLEDIGGSLSASGTADGLLVTAGSAYGAYADGRIISFRATADNTGAATLNVNGIGAKAIRKMAPSGDVALGAGDIQSTGIYVAQYSAALNAAAGAWLLVNPTLTNLTTLTVAELAVSGSIHETINTDQLILSGGNAQNVGASIYLCGAAHAGEANDAFYDAAVHQFRGVGGAGGADVKIDGDLQFVRIDNTSGTTIAFNGGDRHYFGDNVFMCLIDGQSNLGQPANRWAAVFAITGTIQTSDAREKTPLRPMTTSEMDAAKEIARSIGFYRWLKEGSLKGEFCGVTVQDVAAIMKNHDLKPFDYGFIKYEEDRYSLIYTDLLMFLARGFEQRLSELEG